MAKITAKSFIPLKLLEIDLFKMVAHLLDREIDQYETDLDDVRLKYIAPEQLSDEVVKEILKEMGFGYIADLAEEINGVNYGNILVFASYIALLKGHRTGFETIVRMLGLQYELKEWWEHNPKLPEDTISLKVDLDSSMVARPYITFQKFKVFAANYIFPIVDPLQYVLTIPVPDWAWLVYGRPVQTFGVTVPEVVPPAIEIYSRTRVLTIGDSGGYCIRVNNDGNIKAFRQKTFPASSPLIMVSPNESRYEVVVDAGGNIITNATLPGLTGKVSISVRTQNGVDWLLKVDNSGVLYSELA